MGFERSIHGTTVLITIGLYIFGSRLSRTGYDNVGVVLLPDRGRFPASIYRVVASSLCSPFEACVSARRQRPVLEGLQCEAETLKPQVLGTVSSRDDGQSGSC